MGLSDQPFQIATSVLIRPSEPTFSGFHNVLVEVLVDNARGTSYHVNPPVVVEPERGERLYVSNNLGEAWEGTGTCRILPEPAADPEPEAAALPEEVAVEPPPKPKRKRPRRRK